MHAILVFGDSIAFGRGNNTQRGWTGRLRKYFESLDEYNAIYNLAIPGETSTGLLARIEQEAKARTKKIRKEDKHAIILAIGINDSRLLGSSQIPQTRPEVFQENITKLIQIAKTHAQDVVCIGLTPVDEEKTAPYEQTWFTNTRIQEYNAILEEISAQEKIPFLNFFTQLQENNFSTLLVAGLDE